MTRTMSETLRDAHGNVERRYAADVLVRPPIIELEGGRLRWGFRTRPSKPFWNLKDFKAGRLLPGTGLLLGFVNLAHGSDRDILAYARRWGPLGLCEHGLPSGHRSAWQYDDGCAPVGWDGLGGYEHLGDWRRFAVRAHTVLMARTRTPVHLTAAEMNRFRPLPEGAAPWRRVRGREVERMFRSEVNNWIRWGNVHPQYVLSRGTTSLVLAPTWSPEKPDFPLFGVLGLQLGFAAFSERGVAFCSECGTLFEPGHQLRRDTRRYCGDCAADGARERYASKEWRARERKKRAARQTAGSKRSIKVR